MNGKQGGDPAKLARALLNLAARKDPPLRLVAGSDAVAGAEQKIATFQKQIDANRDLATSLAPAAIGVAERACIERAMTSRGRRTESVTLTFERLVTDAASAPP